MMAEGESILMSPTDSSDEALQLDTRTDEASVVNASSDSGDYETLIRTGCESSEHVNADISEVTQEASKVLDQFLKLSLGQGCTSSGEGHAWADVEPQYAVLDNIHKDSQPTPYQPMGSDQSLFESLGYGTGDVGKTIYQELTFPGQQHRGCASLSGRSSPGAAVRQRSAPGKFCIVADDERTYMPLLIQRSEAGHKYPKEGRRKSSSSSVGDYEYSDTVVTNRKRKSLIRLAKERLQRSFRHEKKMTAASAGSPHASREHHGAADKDLRKVGEGSPSEKLRLSRAKGAQKTCYSSSSPYEVGDVLASGGSHPQILAGRVAGTDSGVRHCLSETGYLTGDTDDASKKYSLSPPASKKLGTKSKSKKNRDIFGGILKQLRKSSQKPQLKDKEGNISSTSTMSPTVIRVSCPTDSEGQLAPRKLPSSKDDVPASHSHKTSTFNIGRQKDEAAAAQFMYNAEVAHLATPQSPHVLHCGAGGHDGAQQERRSKMQLEGLVPCLPTAVYAWKEAKAAVMSEQEPGLGPWKGKSLDDIDGGRRDLKAFLLHHSSKPFSQKTEREKDELYEHIAGQLATIAYNYAFDSPHNSSVKPQEPSLVAEGAKSAAVSVEQTKTSGLESSAPSSLQATGDRSPYSLIDSTPVVAELVQSTSYRCFEQIISSSIGTSETGWHQIAMMFRLTQSAIVMAGMGTAVALHIKELTLKYFEDRFANWIVTQGGWESMVDEANTGLDSELD